jgi:hypothetical protein
LDSTIVSDHTTAGDINLSLPVPVGQKGINRTSLDVIEGRSPGPIRGNSYDSGSQRPRPISDILRGERDGVGRENLVRHPRGEKIQSVVVVANEVGRSGEGINDSGAKFGFEDGENGVPNPDSRKTLVDVVWVVPGLEPLGERRSVSRLSRDIEKRSADESVEFRHAAKAAGAAPPRQSKQDRFGLVVSGVTRQNDGSAVTFGGGAQGRVSCVASGCLGTAFRSHDDVYQLDRIQPE